MIAMAVSSNPSLIIADEPTTALDVTVQKQILDLLKSLQERFKTSIIFITHDLEVVSDIADRAAIMYAGQVVESESESFIICSNATSFINLYKTIFSSILRADSISQINMLQNCS